MSRFLIRRPSIAITDTIYHIILTSSRSLTLVNFKVAFWAKKNFYSSSYIPTVITGLPGLLGTMTINYLNLYNYYNWYMI